MLKITKAGPEKLAIVQDIAFTTWPVTYGHLMDKAQLDYMLQLIYDKQALLNQLNAGQEFMIGEWDNNPVAFAAYELNYQQQPVSKLHKIYVLPGMQGKQIGKQMMDEAARIAKEAGMQSLLLNVKRDNPAIGFYERYGFVNTGSVDIEIGNGYWMRDYIMRLTL